MNLVADGATRFELTSVPGLPAVFTGAVAWGDYDHDGRLDFVLTGLEAGTGRPHLSLWRNTGNGFSNVTASVAAGVPGVFDSSVAWGDFDKDGRLDLIVTGLTNASKPGVTQLWRNTADGFNQVVGPGFPNVAESSVSWRDFDGDGRLDLLIAGTTNGNSTGAITQLWRNTGNGFTNLPVPGLPGGWFGSVAWEDFDGDGRPDFLLTGLTNGTSGGAAAQLWRNTGNGFTNVPIPGLRGVYASSISWGDFDHDGHPDFLLEGLAGNAFVSELWRNTDGGFTNVPIPGLPGFADGSLVSGDFDNDGRLDFLITGLTNGATEISQLWLNTGTGFTNVPVPGLPGSFDNALAAADFDNDGRLDFLLAGTSDKGMVSQLWRNTGPLVNPPAPVDLSAGIEGDRLLVSFTANPGGSFTALATTNVSAALTTWAVLGPVPEVAPGHYQFAEISATNRQHRLYRVRSP
jgi:hypothetical protein